MYSIFIKVSKYEVHVTSEDKEYIIPVVYKSKSTKLSSVSKLTFIIVNCSKDILSKFKVMKFIFK